MSILLTIDGEKYDVTDFVEFHPGGRDLLISNNGKDVTDLFHYFKHSKSAKSALKMMKVNKFENQSKNRIKKEKCSNKYRLIIGLISFAILIYFVR